MGIYQFVGPVHLDKEYQLSESNMMADYIALDLTAEQIIFLCMWTGPPNILNILAGSKTRA